MCVLRRVAELRPLISVIQGGGLEWGFIQVAKERDSR